MIFTKYRNTFRWVMIALSFIIISLILWNTYVFFQNFKAEERSKMDIWAEAQSDFINSDTNANLDLTLKILSSNHTTPMIVINKDGSFVNETVKTTTKAKTLNESQKTEITGNKAKTQDTDVDAEIINLRKLAGIN